MKKNRSRAAIAPLMVLLLLIILIWAAASVVTPPPAPAASIDASQPTKDHSTGLYTIYLLVGGLRDLGALHTDLRGNIHVDYIGVYFSNPPSPVGGRSYLTFSKPVHVVVTILGSSLNSSIVRAFGLNVPLGSSWSEPLTVTLPSGTFMAIAEGLDSNGFRSSTTTEVVLP